MHGIEYLKKMVKCINYCDIFVCFWHYILPLVCKANAQAFPVDTAFYRPSETSLSSIIQLMDHERMTFEGYFCSNMCQNQN